MNTDEVSAKTVQKTALARPYFNYKRINFVTELSS
jgi:hypothetical protein